MCTSLTFGRQATQDNQVMVSRNEDFTRNNWNKYMAWRAQPEYANSLVVRDGIWTLGNGLSVPVPKARFAYSAMPDAAAYEEASIAVPHRYFFEERGINQNNVAITATNSLGMNENASAADPLLERGGIAESIIPTLILPQAESARHGIEILGKYIEEYGASEVNGVVIADPAEAWYLENGSAHHWIAVRIPDDSYLVVANGMRIHDVDLDSRDVLHSKGLFEFVAAHRLLATPQRQRFDFAQAFGLTGVPYNVDRIWLAQKRLTPSLEQAPRQQQYPLFLKPDQRVGASDVMAVLRATYAGTELDGIATRPIGYDKTAESHIICLNAEMPQELQGLIWQSISTPLGSPYLPIYNAMREIPQQLAKGSNHYGSNSAYWAFRSLFALANTQELPLLPELQKMWQEREQEFVFQQAYLEPLLNTMYQRSSRQAIAFARHYSAGNALQMVEKAERERNRLMTRLAAEPSVT